MPPSIARPAWPFVAALLLAGTAARGFLAFSPSFTLDADKGVVYLMALRQSHGEAQTIFWGQTYGGTLISTCAGLLMRFLGDSEQVVLAVTIAASTACALVLWRVAFVSLGSVAALVALGLFSFPGVYLLRQSVDDGGFYSTSVLFALLAIWIAVEPTFSDSWWRAGAVGLATGLAFWCSPMGLALAAPAAWVLACRAGLSASVAPMAIGSVVGILPFVQGTVARIAHGDSSGGVANPFIDIPGRVFGLLFRLIPGALPGGEPGSILQVPLALAVIALVVGLLIAAKSKDSIAAEVPLALVLGVGLLVCLLLASGFRLDVDARRYVTFLLPALSFAIAASIVRLARLAYVASMVVVVIAVGGTSWLLIETSSTPVIDVHQTFSDPTSMWPKPGDKFGVDASVTAGVLEEHGVRAGYASYWISYRVTAASRERVILAEVTESRFQPYLDAAADSERTAIVVYRDTAEYDQVQEGPTFHEVIALPGGISIFIYDQEISEAVARMLLYSPES